MTIDRSMVVPDLITARTPMIELVSCEPWMMEPSESTDS